MERFRGEDTPDAGRQLMRLSSLPEPYVVQGCPLVSDGPAMSRMARTPQEDTPGHREPMPLLFEAIHAGNLEGVKAALKQDPEAALNTRYGGFLPLHASCHVRHLDTLSSLLQAGAKVDAVDGLGQTALHLAVADEWHSGVETLLQSGASPNMLCEPPPTIKGMRIETPLHVAVRRGDLTTTALLLRQRPDLSLRDSDLCSVLHLAAHSRSLAVTSELLKERQVKELVTSSDCRGNGVLHMALMTKCDAACEDTVMDLVKELVQAGADTNHLNLRGESPLFLAAHHHLPRVVHTLLDLRADPRVVARNGQTMLHAACHHGCAASLGHLLNTDSVQHLVTALDNEGFAPFHFAVCSGSIDCCELLLTHGDHLTRLDKDKQTRCSIILRHLPSATQLLTRLFDSHVLLSNVPPHDPNFCVTFNYSVIYLEEEGVQSSLISELSTSSLEVLLKHPLLESFLYLKWGRIKPFFYCSVAFYFAFLLLHTIFIVMTFGGQPWNWSTHVFAYSVFLILHITMFLFILIPDLIFMFANFKKYLYQWETYTRFIALSTSAFVVFSCLPSYKMLWVVPALNTFGENNTSLENVTNTPWEVITEDYSTGDNTSGPAEGGKATHMMVQREVVRDVAAVSALFSWVEFMMLLGRFPSLGTYVLMFTRVARSIIKFLAAFSSLIIGFAVSFLVLFRDKPTFSSLPLSFIRTLMMMIGEIDFATLAENLNLLGALFLVAFLFLVCVLLTNLLIGLAVNDLPDLQRMGKIRRLAKQASYLVSYERLMVVARSLRCFPYRLRKLMTRRSKVPQEVNVWPNKNNGKSNSRRSDFYHVPNETLQEAILLGTDSKIVFNAMDDEDSLAMQFRSFKIMYDRDHRQLQRRLAKLPDTTTTETMLKQRLDHIQQTLQNQLLQLSLQLQQHNHLCSRCRHNSQQTQGVQSEQQAGPVTLALPNNLQGRNTSDRTQQRSPIQSSSVFWPLRQGQGAAAHQSLQATVNSTQYRNTLIQFTKR